jgi:hypothetical protein
VNYGSAAFSHTNELLITICQSQWLKSLQRLANTGILGSKPIGCMDVCYFAKLKAEPSLRSPTARMLVRFTKPVHILEMLALGFSVAATLDTRHV